MHFFKSSKLFTIITRNTFEYNFEEFRTKFFFKITVYRASGDLESAKEARLKWRMLNKSYEAYSLRNGRAYYPRRTRITLDEKEYYSKEPQSIVNNQQINQNTIDNGQNDGIIESKKPIFIEKSSLPSMFFSNKKIQKTTDLWIKTTDLSKVQNQNIVKLFTNMNSISTNNDITTIGFAELKNQFTYYYHPMTKNIVEAKLVLREMKDESSIGARDVNSHEIGHMIDFYLRKGDKSKIGSLTDDLELTEIVRKDDNSVGSIIEDTFQKAMDDMKSNSLGLRKKANDQRKNNADDYKAQRIDYNTYKKNEKLIEKERNLRADEYNRNNHGGAIALMDIYDALSGGKFKKQGIVNYGHGDDYKNTRVRNSEIWANYMVLNLHYPNELAQLRVDKPVLCKKLDAMLEEVVKEKGV